MACGATLPDKTHGTLSCTNPGTSAHAGPHTASVSAFKFLGVVGGSRTVKWHSGNTAAAAQGPHVVGQAVPQ